MLMQTAMLAHRMRATINATMMDTGFGIPDGHLVVAGGLRWLVLVAAWRADHEDGPDTAVAWVPG